ncbi:hypothetical protein GCM10023149_49920 [Mucilaginibacter gynuensis]|uniref:N-acetyltransferase domain-containing protein n=1 Tax=Mucilaginibacter gynuensis TaxID=1302236 RepID=A0ABP8HHI8_9SPHI
MVNLYCTKDDDTITGFLGLSDDMVQMLFIHPDARGKGHGSQLLNFAINQHGITKVDVNEQNQQALGFYQRFGFTIIDRAETDAVGRPYPVLSMRL